MNQLLPSSNHFTGTPYIRCYFGQSLRHRILAFQVAEQINSMQKLFLHPNADFQDADDVISTIYSFEGERKGEIDEREPEDKDEEFTDSVEESRKHEVREYPVFLDYR